MKKLGLFLTTLCYFLIVLIGCESKTVEESNSSKEEVQSSALFDMSVETLALDLLHDCFPNISATTFSDIFEVTEVNKNMLLLVSETLEYNESLEDFIWLIERTVAVENKDVQFSFANGMFKEGVFSLSNLSEVAVNEANFDEQSTLPDTTLSLEEQILNFLIVNIPDNLFDYSEVDVSLQDGPVPTVDVTYNYSSQSVSNQDVKNAVGTLNVLQREIDSNIYLILTFTDGYYIVNEDKWIFFQNEQSNQSNELSSREIVSSIVLDKVPSDIVPYVDSIDFYPGQGMDSVYVYLSISNYDISYDIFVELQQVLPELQLYFGSISLCYVFDSGMEENTYNVNVDMWY